jgi:glycosyltransferase involved in cell wall biosynthesis
MKKGVSVIIPVFNREHFVAEAIQSVIDQDYKGEIEIIITDDGSTDNTLDVAASFGNQVKILKKPNGCFTQGASASRNRGIGAASKEYICFLDSDDFYLPGHLNKMVTILENEIPLGFAFCRIMECQEIDNKRKFRPWTHQKIFKTDIKNPVVSRSHIVHTNSFMFRKEVFEKVGYFNESYQNGEDGDLWMRISEFYKGAFVNHFGAIYKTRHDYTQLSKTKKDENKDAYFKIYSAAVSRYYTLGLKSPFRIFKLKHMLLHLQFQNKKYIYYTKYLKLIIRYPFSLYYILRQYHYNAKIEDNNFRLGYKFWDLDTTRPSE